MKTYVSSFRSNQILKSLLFILLFSCYLLSCKTTSDSNLKGRSIGAPGEVLVVADLNQQKEGWLKEIREFANQAFPCLPQYESTFRLTVIVPDEFEGHFKAYRNIIRVQRDLSGKSEVRYNNDVWASYQRVVNISAPGVLNFNKVFEDHKDRIYDFFYYGDIKNMHLANVKGANASSRKLINDRYQIDLILPDGYRLVKDTLDFTWFRYDNLETTICVYVNTFDLSQMKALNTNDLMFLRDSIGKTFIPGPSINTYMQTEQELPVQFNQLIHNNQKIMELRGLWKVHGFFMGGPFVDYFIKNEQTNELVMVGAFVYAPQKQNKSYYVRQLESILHSVKIL